MNEVQQQRDYYTRTAENYEQMHVHERDEHMLNLAVFTGLVRYFGGDSIMDVGSGTGRAIRTLKIALPECQVLGIEPVAALREEAYRLGIDRDALIQGDVMRMPFASASHDWVCEFGMLHHVRNPLGALVEMFRVARKGVFLSDSNRFGQGHFLVRRLKWILWRAGVWPLVDYLKTCGKGYTRSEGDGIAYSFSVFDHYAFICKLSESVHVFNTSGDGGSALLGAPHVGLLAIKR